MTSSPPSSDLSPAVLPESPPLRVGNRQQGLRSLKNLISHFTARADDSHATPVWRLQAAARFHVHPSICQALVRFLAYHRIKPHAPPLVRAPVNSFEFHPKPVCSPHLRASASVHGQMSAFATGVLPDIYRFHPYTWNSDIPSCTPARQFPTHHGVEPRTFTSDLPGRLRALYAQ